MPVETAPMTSRSQPPLPVHKPAQAGLVNLPPRLQSPGCAPLSNYKKKTIFHAGMVFLLKKKSLLAMTYSPGRLPSEYHWR